MGSKAERASQVLREEGQGGSGGQHRGSGEGFAPGAELAVSPRTALEAQVSATLRPGWGPGVKGPCALGHHQSPGAGSGRRLEQVPLPPHPRAARGQRPTSQAQDLDTTPCHLSCYGCCGDSLGRGLQRGVGRREQASLGARNTGGCPGTIGTSLPSPVPTAASQTPRAQAPSCAHPPAAGLPAPGPLLP